MICNSLAYLTFLVSDCPQSLPFLCNFQFMLNPCKFIVWLMLNAPKFFLSPFCFTGMHPFYIPNHFTPIEPHYYLFKLFSLKCYSIKPELGIWFLVALQSQDLKYHFGASLDGHGFRLLVSTYSNAVHVVQVSWPHLSSSSHLACLQCQSTSHVCIKQIVHSIFLNNSFYLLCWSWQSSCLPLCPNDRLFLAFLLITTKTISTLRKLSRDVELDKGFTNEQNCPFYFHNKRLDWENHILYY